MKTINKINEKYWEEIEISNEDIEFIYNHLLEKEIPLKTDDILYALIENRINREQEKKEKQLTDKKVYLPKNDFEIGDTVNFSSIDLGEAEVINVRNGINPDIDDLKVIQVKFDSGEIREYASSLEQHQLNSSFESDESNENLDPSFVYKNYKDFIFSALEQTLSENEELVNIAGSWFPRSLLVDVHIGHLNLAEAVLEEANGGPIGTLKLMDQVELEAKVDRKLLEFSFDLALQEDERFDEVGPAGETLWFLRSKEPDFVREVPITLRYDDQELADESIKQYLALFETNVYDELEVINPDREEHSDVSISLSYPHWRAGTLPLSLTLKKMFPTAYEAPRVRFTFVDHQTKENFPGWVVRKHQYVYGLKEWYENNEMMPGSLVTVSNGEKPGEIDVNFQKSRQNKEWLKTVLVGTDRAVVFAMLKQSINVDFNERMAIAIPDTSALDEIWEHGVYLKNDIGKTIIHIMRELIKLNPQGQVHAQELYAAVNVVRRCPPGMIVYNLLQNSNIEYLGDLYFKISEKRELINAGSCKEF